jgi:hypothetical protein
MGPDWEQIKQDGGADWTQRQQAANEYSTFISPSSPFSTYDAGPEITPLPRVEESPPFEFHVYSSDSDCFDVSSELNDAFVWNLLSFIITGVPVLILILMIVAGLKWLWITIMG